MKPLVALGCPSPYAIAVEVLEVFDGDGLRARVTRSNSEVFLRFGFIDAPEMGQPGGVEARDFLLSLVGGREILINILVKSSTMSSFDRYRRLVCVPFLPSERPDRSLLQHLGDRLLGKPAFRNVELEMVLNGWAWVLDRYGPDQAYFDALDEARRQRRGIWAYENNVDPWIFKRQKGVAARARCNGQAQGGDGVCPRQGCSGTLVRKNGRFGPFLGCSTFPSCRYTRSTTSK